MAYLFDEWTDEGGYICAPGGVRKAPELTEAELEAPSPATHATFRVVKAGEAVCQRILVSNRVFEDHNYCLRHFSASV